MKDDFSDLLRAKALLKEDPARSCAFVSGEEEFCSFRKGVQPLLAMIDEGKSLAGFSAADKILGKGAALLYVYLDVSKIYASVMSKPAEEVLRAHDIYYEYDVCTANILNRAGDGICPMEVATSRIDDPKEALQAIRLTLASLKNN